MTKRKIFWFSIFVAFIGFNVSYIFLSSEPPNEIKINRIVVNKLKRQLLTYSDGKLIKTYKISLGRKPVGKKEFEGDKKTPEGIYFIDSKNPNSGYYKSLGISYPNSDDILNSARIGKPSGGNIKIHGLRNGTGFIGKIHLLFDWTLGCIAVTDYEIDEIYNNVEIGAEIEIKP